MNSFIEKLLSHPQRNLILAMATAVFLSLGWYFPFTPFLFIGLVPLLLLERELSGGDSKRPLLTFWKFSFLALFFWNIGVYWWLWHASSWTTFAAWGANAALQTLPLVLFYLIKKTSGNRFGYFALVCSWLGFEYLHLHWDLSWVWLHLGNAFGQTPSWVQWYEYTGAFGGTLWVLLINILVLNVVLTGRVKIRLALTIAFPLFWSWIVWLTYEEEGEQMEMVMVQPNLDCYTEKFNYNAKTGERDQATYVPYPEQVNRFIELSQEAITPQTKWVAWPETSLHKGFIEGKQLQYPDISKVFEWKKEHPQTSLITGVDTYKMYGENPETITARYRPQTGYFDVANSALLINDQQEMEIYNKSQLVIGVETIPFPAALKPIMLNLGGSSGGLGRQTEREVFFDSDSIGIAPVICYESVYGEYVTEYVQKGADVLTVITNDGWWSDSPGHRQHMYFSQLRAIENRKPVVRAANTGVSCFINSKGEIYQSLEYGKMGAIRDNVTLNPKTTFYSQHGDYLGRLAAFLAPFMLLAGLVKRRVKR